MRGSRALISKGLLLAVFCTLWVGVAAAQFGSVRGTCRDPQGTPIAGAQIVWKNQNDGRVYNLKTDKKGSFFSLGIEPGDYQVTLSKDGQVLDQQKNVHVGLDEFVYDVDLKKIQQQNIEATAKKEGKSSAEVQQQVQQQQADLEKSKKYNDNVKVVNEKLAAAKTLMDAKNYPQAIATYQEAANIMPDKDVVWFRLGAAYADSARTQTDAAEKTKQNTEAYTDLQKAVELNKAAPPAKDPTQAQKDKQNLAAFYDNLGAVSARLGKVDESVGYYEQAVQLDPSGASRYYFNEGITLYNSAGDEASRKKAVAALDKVLAADPNKADAYFLKGATLFAMSTQADGKLEAPAGTGESLQKYLELQPSGGYADQAKGMLSMLGQKVESSFGGSKSKKK